MISDALIREHALNPHESFIVEAPAGSGKTELLVRRFLKLLQGVKTPESILAITFTRKAASEMKARIMKALPDSEIPFLEERLNIMTIDAFCYQIAASRPLSSDIVGRDLVQDETALNTKLLAAFLEIIETGDIGCEDLIALFQYFDNQLEETSLRILRLLKNREEWLPIVLMARDKGGINSILQNSIDTLHQEILQELEHVLPLQTESELTQFLDSRLREENKINQLKSIVPLFFTQKFELRKRFDARLGLDISFKNSWQEMLCFLESNERLRDLLIRIAHLPEIDFKAHPILEVLLRVLPLAAAHLKLILAEQNETDFHEIALAALALLQEEGQEALRHLDAEIQHILVDEFQDTSNLQFKLLQLLTQEWQAGEGRTLFLVGDPKQSIYRFRNAEVGLFLEAKNRGIGALKLKNLQLTQNFRTEAPLLNWINETCSAFFPKVEDERLGKVLYVKSEAIERELSSVKPVCEHFFETEHEEAEWIAAEINDIQTCFPNERIAVLIRARSHYQTIISALEEAGLEYSVREDRRWLDSMHLHDLLSLLYALNHLGDHLAWSAILRSPLCGMPFEKIAEIVQKPGLIWTNLKLDPDAAFVINALEPYIDGKDRQQDFYLKFRYAVARLNQQGVNQAILGRLSQYLLHLEMLPTRETLQEGLRSYDFGGIESEAPIELLTIHQAKGLEFEHVFLPALHKRVAAEDSPLLYTETFYHTRAFHFLLAERKSRGGEASSLYHYIDWLEGHKDQYEAMRLLYVALTRAKKSLHLSAVVKNDSEKGQVILRGTFLSLLHQGRES